MDSFALPTSGRIITNSMTLGTNTIAQPATYYTASALDQL